MACSQGPRSPWMQVGIVTKKDIIVQKARSSGRPGGSQMTDKGEGSFSHENRDLEEKQRSDALVFRRKMACYLEVK